VKRDGASTDEPEPKDDAAPRAELGDEIGRDEPAAAPERRPARTRIARLVALAGVLAVVLASRELVLPLVPADHAVDLRLDSPQEVVGLDIRWSAPGSDEDIATTSLRFSPGQAPASAQVGVRLPDGEYDVAITIERVARVDSTRRRIALRDAARVTIPLR
jgi:hypothetical protein